MAPGHHSAGHPLCSMRRPSCTSLLKAQMGYRRVYFCWPPICLHSLRPSQAVMHRSAVAPPHCTARHMLYNEFACPDSCTTQRPTSSPAKMHPDQSKAPGVAVTAVDPAPRPARPRARPGRDAILSTSCLLPARAHLGSKRNATASKASWSCKSQPGAAYLSAHSPHAPCGPRTYLPPVLISSLSLYMTLRAARDNVSHAAVVERLQQAPPSSRRARGGPCNLPAACGRSGVGPVHAQRGRRSQNRPTAFLAICCRHLGSLAYSARGLPNTCRTAGRAPGSQGLEEAGRCCVRGPVAQHGRPLACSQHSSARAAARQSGARAAAREGAPMHAVCHKDAGCSAAHLFKLRVVQVRLAAEHVHAVLRAQPCPRARRAETCRVPAATHTAQPPAQAGP